MLFVSDYFVICRVSLGVVGTIFTPDLFHGKIIVVKGSLYIFLVDLVRLIDLARVIGNCLRHFRYIFLEAF